MCHVLHYSCNVSGAVADSLHCRMICGTVPSSVHAWMPPAMAATWSPAAAHSKSLPLCVFCVFFCYILHSCCVTVSTVGWTWWDWSLILRTYLPSVLWHCWLGHSTRKTCPPYDLRCVWWDVKPCFIYLCNGRGIYFGSLASRLACWRMRNITWFSCDSWCSCWCDML